MKDINTVNDVIYDASQALRNEDDQRLIDLKKHLNGVTASNDTQIVLHSMLDEMIHAIQTLGDSAYFYGKKIVLDGDSKKMCKQEGMFFVFEKVCDSWIKHDFKNRPMAEEFYYAQA